MTQELDLVIVGAGFSGMYLLHRARRMGLTAQVIEAGDDVGGTWYWNRYPGARCDIESMSYSYSFDPALEQDWHWADRYSVQPDILRYAQHVADRFDLRRDILFNDRVISARHDERANRWTLRTDGGREFRAQFCVMATGCLSVAKTPDIKGIESFAGAVHHTASWPHDGVDFAGQRVGLIGTGSSGIQATPHLAAQARHLTVFQRTPNFSIPAWNGPIPAEQERDIKLHYRELRALARTRICADFAEEGLATVLTLTPEQREIEFEKRWRQGGFNYQYAFTDVLEDEAANELAAEFVRRKIREKVRDPKIAEMLCPRDHPFGTKRLCVDTDYYETFNRPNVTLVDLKATPIEEVTPKGVRTSAGFHELDALVLATGFDAMTGALTAIDIRGRGDRSLAETWRGGARCYLGLAIAGFPNLFTINGPGSPSVFTCMIPSIEQHVEWITDFIDYMRRNGIAAAEASAAAQEDWVRQVNEGADRTLYPKANSWYVGANVPGKPRVFLPYADGFGKYAGICAEIAAQGYRGFKLSKGAGSGAEAASAGAAGAEPVGGAGTAAESAAAAGE
jgi:cyclohexanone monooxygenase